MAPPYLPPPCFPPPPPPLLSFPPPPRRFSITSTSSHTLCALLHISTPLLLHYQPYLLLVLRNRRPGKTQGKEKKCESALHGQCDRALLEVVSVMAAIGLMSVVVVVCVCMLVGWRGVRGDGGGVVLWGWRGVGCEGWGCDGDGMIRNLHSKHFCKKRKKGFLNPKMTPRYI